MKRRLSLILVLSFAFGGYNGLPLPHAQAATQAPVLKWQRGGCYASWCETGWYSSPAVADIDSDGKPEVIASAYSIVSLDGATGALEWRVASGHDRSQPAASSVGRTWPGIIVADVDYDGNQEIVTGHGGGWVSVYNGQGYFEAGWPKQPLANEVRGVSVADLDNNGDLEIIATGAHGSEVNAWVYEHNGSLRSGWPQLRDEGGYAWGVFNDNAAAGDLDGDGIAEIIVPSDVHYINAYRPDGSHIQANAMYGGKNWGKVGIWESPEIELRGWGACDGVRAESYRTNFADGPANIVDVNGDGAMEVVVTGNVYDCHAGYPPSRYTGVYIFNADRSRFNTGGFDWRSGPVDTGAPISESYSVIESAQSNPAAADLDGDGRLEILFASYDGRLHAYWLDKTEHGNWPYAAYRASDGYLSFASEPAVADLDADGHAEVIFTTWTQKGSGQTGKLYVLDYLGSPLHVVSLPAAVGSPTWNGALPAPTLADIDGDPDLEVVINTAHAGFVAYDLPGTAHARVLWGTGRGSYQRSGVILQGVLKASISASTTTPAAGETLTYTINLSSLNLPLEEVDLTAVLPEGLDYAGGLTASSGTPNIAGKTITWHGAVNVSNPVHSPVVIRFLVQVDASIVTAQALATTLTVTDGLGHTHERRFAVIANGQATYLPLIRR
ncbi:MAG: FG-GAP-like repeat-containing protein [Chloroflexota bacterium]